MILNYLKFPALLLEWFRMISETFQNSKLIFYDKITISELNWIEFIVVIVLLTLNESIAVFSITIKLQIKEKLMNLIFSRKCKQKKLLFTKHFFGWIRTISKIFGWIRTCPHSLISTILLRTFYDCSLTRMSICSIFMGTECNKNLSKYL